MLVIVMIVLCDNSSGDCAYFKLCTYFTEGGAVQCLADLLSFSEL
jgi:hypothetical protein